MRRAIPAPVMAVVADIVATLDTHASIDSLFLYAGAPGDPPTGSKPVKALDWLRRINKDQSVADPLSVLGRIIEHYMEEPPDPRSIWDEDRARRKERINNVLISQNLQYVNGGKIAGALAGPSLTLAEIIRGRDVHAISLEFDRSYENIERNPREAVSAACNILESICKIYIEDENLKMPARLDLQPVWSVVRKDLRFDPAELADRDLQEILSGLIAVVNGIGGLRTHASSAHGTGRKGYRLEARHARLAVHAAHTIATFIIESWDRKHRNR